MGRLTSATACLALAAATLAVARPLTFPSQAERVVVVSIDGLRPDLLSSSLTPAIAGLMREGSYSRTAMTVSEGYTLPSHVSMLTGVSPERHGVSWNRHIEEAYPQAPTLFALARGEGRTTAMFAGKTKFTVFTRPGELNWVFLGVEGRNNDMDIARRAAQNISNHLPDVLFVHLADVDLAGHEHGWASAEQRAAISAADAALAVVLRSLDSVRESTLIIVTADHGGEGLGHDPKSELSQLIPWIAAGPGFRRNFDLAAAGVAVDTRATFATACAALGIPLPGEVEVGPVRSLIGTPEQRHSPMQPAARSFTAWWQQR